MNKILILALLLFSTVACKKSKVDSVNTNDSRDSLTYQPNVAGSKWSYQMTLGGVLKSDYNVTCLNYDSVINGRTYRVFNDEKQGLQFIRQDGDQYFSVITAAANKTELMIIDASKAVGESWVGGVNGNDTYTYTMSAKYPTYDLDGFTFKNVLKIYQERKNGNNVTLSGDSYYAQGVGNILIDGKVSGVSTYVKLTSVDLK